MLPLNIRGANLDSSVSDWQGHDVCPGKVCPSFLPPGRLPSTLSIQEYGLRSRPGYITGCLEKTNLRRPLLFRPKLGHKTT